MKAVALVALALVVALPGPALAQAAVSADDLPVSLARIKRELGKSQAREDGHGLKLTYYVNVVGETPPINIFKDFDAKNGPVPGGIVTSKEIFNHLTPQEFSAPAADVLGAAVWLGSTFVKKVIDNHRK